jgi:hypothetical protein
MIIFSDRTQGEMSFRVGHSQLSNMRLHVTLRRPSAYVDEIPHLGINSYLKFSKRNFS